MTREPADFAAADLTPGMREEFEIEVTEQMVRDFARLSGDENPLHVDPSYAKETTYKRPIAHGALEIALASRMAGMHLPGKRVLLLGVTARYVEPLYYPCRVRVRGEIAAYNPRASFGLLKVSIEDLDRKKATAELSMPFSMHKESAEVITSAGPEPTTGTDEKPTVLLTGASGGLGRVLAASLSKDYRVIGVLHETAADDLAGTIELIEADLSASDFEARVEVALSAAPLYGIVHSAWPGAPRGGLLDTRHELVEEQLSFAAGHTIRLARLLADRSKDSGRLIAIGSSFGSLHPNLGLSAYSLGKAVLEHTVRLLAPELARKQITVNVIAPDMMRVGMNEGASDAALLRHEARVPAGRLATVEDVAGLVTYLLSEQSSFVSGQIIGVTGGRLT